MNRPGWKSSGFHFSAGTGGGLAYLAMDHGNPLSLRLAAVVGLTIVAVMYVLARAIIKTCGPIGWLVSATVSLLTPKSKPRP